MTKRQIPSAAQMRVLEAMRDGAWIEHWPGYAVPVELCDPGQPFRSRVNFSTHRSIYHAGWTAREDQASRPSSQYRRYYLTNLGRAALDAAKEDA